VPSFPLAYSLRARSPDEVVTRDAVLGKLAGEFVRAPSFLQRNRGVLGRLMRRIVGYLRPVRVMLGFGVAAAALQAVMQWLAPWPLKLIFDSVLAHHKLPGALRWLPASQGGLLDALVLAMFAIAVLLGVFSYLSNRLVATAGQRVVYDLRCDLFRHLEAQSLGFHQRRSTGDLMSRLSGDTQAIQNLTVNAVPTFVSNLLTLVGMVVIMALVDWQFTLLALSVIPVMAWTVQHYLKRIKTAQRHARRFEGLANGAAQEVLTSLPVVQAFGTEAAEASRFATITGEGLEASRRSIVLQSEFTPLVTVTMTAATVLVIFFGSRAVISGQLTPGYLLVFSAYLRGMYTPVRQLAKLANIVGRGQAAAERVVEILDTSEEGPPRPTASTSGRLRGRRRRRAMHRPRRGARVRPGVRDGWRLRGNVPVPRHDGVGRLAVRAGRWMRRRTRPLRVERGLRRWLGLRGRGLRGRARSGRGGRLTLDDLSLDSKDVGARLLL